MFYKCLSFNYLYRWWVGLGQIDDILHLSFEIDAEFDEIFHSGECFLMVITNFPENQMETDVRTKWYLCHS